MRRRCLKPSGKVCNLRRILSCHGCSDGSSVQYVVWQPDHCRNMCICGGKHTQGCGAGHHRCTDSTFIRLATCASAASTGCFAVPAAYQYCSRQVSQMQQRMKSFPPLPLRRIVLMPWLSMSSWNGRQGLRQCLSSASLIGDVNGLQDWCLPARSMWSAAAVCTTTLLAWMALRPQLSILR